MQLTHRNTTIAARTQWFSKNQTQNAPMELLQSNRHTKEGNATMKICYVLWIPNRRPDKGSMAAAHQNEEMLGRAEQP
jgi:hypothetical protein